MSHLTTRDGMAWHQSPGHMQVEPDPIDRSIFYSTKHINGGASFVCEFFQVLGARFLAGGVFFLTSRVCLPLHSTPPPTPNPPISG